MADVKKDEVFKDANPEGGPEAGAEDEFEDFDGADDYDEMVQGGGYGDLQGLIRRSKRGNLIATDELLDATEDLQIKAFREVARSFLLDERVETKVTPALLMERSAEIETPEQVAERADRIWAREFEKLCTETDEPPENESEDPSSLSNEQIWEKSMAKKVLKSFYDASVDSESTKKEEEEQPKPDTSWVHKEEAEIARALNGALAKDRKKNKILQKLSQLGERLTPDNAAEMARARLAAAEAAAALAGDVAPELETFAPNKANLPSNQEREEVALRAFVKLDPDKTLEQLGLFVKAPGPTASESEFGSKPSSNKSVKISES